MARLFGNDANDRFWPSANFLLKNANCGMDLILTHGRLARNKKEGG